MPYDFIIAGGGPAGAVAAYCLQKAGRRCLIIDKKKKVGEKVCGGLLTWSGISALQKAGLDTEMLIQQGASRIRQFVCITGENMEIHRYHSGEYGLGVSRRLLDQWLLDQAASAGTRIHFGEALGEIRQDGGQFQTGSHTATYLVIATGARGYVPEFMRKELCDQSFGISARIKGSPLFSEETVLFFITGANGLDYFWIIPNGNRIWNIGVWFRKAPADAAARFWKQKQIFADKYFKDISFIRKPMGAFCGSVDLTGQFPDGCHGIGDAAGMNRADTGEGLRYAIESAVSLASSIGGRV